MELEKIKIATGSAIGGAIVAVAIGFGWGGWMFESKAADLADKAVVERLVPVCVARFMADPKREEKQKALQAADYTKKNDYVVAQGWATIPGADKPNPDVVNQCIRQIEYAGL